MSRLTSWPSKDGAIPIKEMETNHLYNTVRTLHGYAEDRRRKLRVKGTIPSTTPGPLWIGSWIWTERLNAVIR